MASVPSLPLENGKEDSVGRSDPLNLPCEVSNRHDPPDTRESRQLQDNALQNPSLVTPLAAFPPTGSTGLSVPYIPTFSVQHCISPEGKIVVNGGGNGLVAEGELDAEEEKKRDREHKKRSKNWTRPETLKLIRLRTELAPRFARTGRKSELWDQIAVALQQDQFSRDAQQCRDKWEKLMAGYKEVRDGLKEREDNPFYEELHPLLSGKASRRDRESLLFQHENENEVAAQQAPPCSVAKDVEKEGKLCTKREGGTEEDDDTIEERMPLRKRKRGPKYAGVTDLHAVQNLLETVVSRQHKIFREFLDALERKEQLREQMRQDREEKWRAEERTQRCIFNNAMIALTQKLVGERVGATSGLSAPLVCNPVSQQGPMKRSKNWKRGEVLQLIKLRGEMEAKFSKSTRRAALWDELSEALAVQGIKRDGKQCREKWDKLMSEYKDVHDGKREQGDSPYFAELTAVLGSRPGEAG